MVNKSPLKWAGSKARIIDKIKAALPPGRRLIEPFVGSGTVFLNTDYESYVLGDLNHDLINFFGVASAYPGELIAVANAFYKVGDSQDSYYDIRNVFNKETNQLSKAAIFLYLNRHCYNGLCRYNKAKGFNVPYGHYKKPYFPKDEIIFLSEKARKTTFVYSDFSAPISIAGAGDVIYCDPPYLPKPGVDSHTAYIAEGFSVLDHRRLVDALKMAHERGASVVISNRLTDEALSLYEGFEITELSAHRSISCKSNGRAADREIIALLRAA